MKVRFISSISIFLLLFILVANNSLAAGFIDVDKEDWYFDSIEALSENKYLHGYPDGSFKPERDISFAEFLRLALSSVTGQDYPLIMDTHWGMSYYIEAVNLNIFTGDDFSLEDFNTALSREDMAYIIVNLNEKIQKEESIKSKGEDIIDLDKVADNRKPYVIQAYEKGLLEGKDTGFKPLDPTSRAEASMIILRLLNKDARIK